MPARRSSGRSPASIWPMRSTPRSKCSETGGKYYVCYQGAWFVGATPNGPWALADSVPPAIHSIPPSSPVYNVSYVNVYGSTAETVTYGYTAGYTMGYRRGRRPGVRHRLLLSALCRARRGAGLTIRIPTPMPAASGTTPPSAPGRVAAPCTARMAARSRRARRTIRRPAPGRAAARSTDPMAVPVPGRPTIPPPAPTHTAAPPGDRTAAPPMPVSTIRATASSGSTTQNANAYSRWGSSTISGPNRTVNTASASNARGSAGAISSSTGAAAAGVHTRTGNNAGDRSHRQRQRVCRRRRQRLQAHRHRLVEVGQRLAVDEIAD